MALENTPQVNPAGLGLASFGLTTVLLSLINAGVLPAGGEAVTLPLAMALGGTAQIIAGIMEARIGNTFGTTAFVAYGAFWWWFALLGLLGSNGVLNMKAAGGTAGAALMLWGVFTLYMWIATFKLNRVVFAVFLTLWVTFFLLGGGALMANPMLSHLGGLLGIVCGTLALYGSFAIVTNSTFGRTVLPLG